MQRRTFLAAAASAPLLAAQSGATRLPIRKGMLLSMLPKKMTALERFTLARDCGFQSMECGTEPDLKVAEEIKAASEKVGLPIHSVMNMAHWGHPFSSSDPADLELGRKGMLTSLDNAKLWGATTVLLVPGVVKKDVTYKQAWDRSTAEIKKLIPEAAKRKVIIAIEEVWNKFIISPLEMAAYIDQFKSPWVKAYLDVGNMVLYGFPQDWIRTLGPRIAKVHLKDFRFENMKAEFLNLRDGQIDWKAVHDALAEVGYKGDATVEVSGSPDESKAREYFTDLAKRVDLILEGA
jgi:hexulose-6-phosphate isomerase